ncbi:MAG: DUF512 domain-containing protein [Clostridiales bacterium]|nr:DUF512 domain-containing protein [Clostridiales bacterium]
MANKREEFRRIKEVVPGSIAEEIGVEPGYILVSIDGVEVRDVFDYRIRERASEMLLAFRLPDGQIAEVDLEKDEDEELGLVFEDPIMCNCTSCANRCIFCFIDQNPKGMRETLYFKDDDMRMSFLTGNYVTLTNLSDKEFERIIGYHLSPINVSVHATDPVVREKMINNKFAYKLMPRLKKMIENGISINCQIVCCPGYNNGAVLDQTIHDLAQLGEGVLSIAVVPVGVTKFREENGLVKLELFNKKTAGELLDQVAYWQDYFMKTRGQRIFFAADEFYVRAERPIPSAEEYEGYPQLENGVGMLSERDAAMTKGIALRKKHLPKNISHPYAGKRFTMISGTDAAPYTEKFAKDISLLYNIDLVVLAVLNEFFGHTITVSGLLTGGDISNAVLAEREAGRGPDVVILTANMMKADEDIFLDDMTLTQFKEKVGIPVIVAECEGSGALKALDTFLDMYKGVED